VVGEVRERTRAAHDAVGELAGRRGEARLHRPGQLHRNRTAGVGERQPPPGVALLHEAGARTSRGTWLFFGGCAGDPRFPALVENMAFIVESARDAIVSSGLLPAREFEAALGELRRWGTRPGASFWYAIFWAEGTRP